MQFTINDLLVLLLFHTGSQFCNGFALSIDTLQFPFNRNAESASSNQRRAYGIR